MIEVAGLHYRYPGNRALDDVSFSLRAGSITALVGPNGAGKTTLLRCIAGLDEPYAGSIRLDGIDVIEAPRNAHQRLGFLPDHFGLYAELSARRCLQHAGASRGLGGASLHQRIVDVAEQVGLSGRLDHLASELSRGQRQRLALAQSIIHRPAALLLDEPASGLDPEARAGLSSLMKTLAANGMTLLVSSHILAELEEYCTGMLVLRGGRVIEHRQLHAAATVAQPQARQWRLLMASPVDAERIRSALPAGWTLQGGPSGDWLLSAVADDTELPSLLQALLAAGLPICSFSQVGQSLQDAYLASVRENGA